MKRSINFSATLAVVAALLLSGAGPAASAPAPVPGDPLTGSGVGTRTINTSANLAATTNPGGVFDSTAGWGLPTYAAAPLHNFQGTLRINNVNSAGSTGYSQLYDPNGNQYFSSSAFWYRYLPYSATSGANSYLEQQFVQNGSYLIPNNRGFRYLSSFNWDILWGVGRAWSESGDTVDGTPASRASVPFTLVFKEENCAFNGLMTFLYTDTGMSRVRYQVSSETCAYYKGNLWGNLAAQYTKVTIANADAIGSAFAEELANRMPTKPITSLVTDYPAAGIDLAAFTTGISAAHITNYGFVYNGVKYVGNCVTRVGNTLANAAGLHPFCDQVIMPSYSTSKSIFMGGALMLLGQKYGEGVGAELVRDWVPEVAAVSSWDAVTFNNLVDMASGHYTSPGNQVDEAGTTMVGFFGIANTTRAQKMPHAMAFPSKVAPGTEWVYHTSDSFILSAAMNAYLKSKAGPSADIWTMFYDEVLAPIGVSPDASRTKRTTDASGTPWGGYGLFWTQDDLAKIGALFAGGDGSHNGTQLLNENMMAASLQRDSTDTGLSTGTGFLYNNGFWARPFTSVDNAAFTTPFTVPFMSGFGGITVALMPNCSAFYMVSDNYEHAWASVVTESNKLDSMSDPACVPHPTTLSNDTANTAYETAVTVDVLGNDGLTGEPGLDAATLRLLDGTTPVTTLTVAGGTFAIISGQVQFTPASSFTGVVPAVDYQVTNADGILGTATLTVTVGAAPRATTLKSDANSSAFGTAAIIDVLGNDGLIGEPVLDPTTLRILDGTIPVPTLTLTEGVFEVESGRIKFTPANGFSGTATITYQVTNSDGIASTATIAVTIATAVFEPETNNPSTDVLASTGPVGLLAIGLIGLGALVIGAGFFAPLRSRKRAA